MVPNNCHICHKLITLKKKNKIDVKQVPSNLINFKNITKFKYSIEFVSSTPIEDIWMHSRETCQMSGLLYVKSMRFHWNYLISYTNRLGWLERKTTKSFPKKSSKCPLPLKVCLESGYPIFFGTEDLCIGIHPKVWWQGFFLLEGRVVWKW